MYLSRSELCDIAVVALLNILVCTLQDGLLLQGGHSLLLLHAAQPRIGVCGAPGEVDAALDGVVAGARVAACPARPAELLAMAAAVSPAAAVPNKVS